MIPVAAPTILEIIERIPAAIERIAQIIDPEAFTSVHDVIHRDTAREKARNAINEMLKIVSVHNTN
jgi:hypothetical protein